MFKKITCLAIAVLFAANVVMAGTASVSITQSTIWGNKRVTYGIITYSGLGATVTCTASQLGLTKVDYIMFFEYGSGSYGNDYNLVWADGAITPLVKANTAANFIPGTHTNYPEGDSVNVHNKALVAADQETSNVYVTLPSGGGSWAALGAFTTVGGTTEALKSYSMFMAADSSRQFFMGDTLDHPAVRLLDASWVNADTVYFDYNGTDATARLMYSGTNLGDQGDLYVPFGTGKFIKIAKKTNSQITQAVAKPLYFVRADADYDDDKLMSDVLGAVDNYNGFLADSTYTSLPRFIENTTTRYTSTAYISFARYFVAIGN